MVGLGEGAGVDVAAEDVGVWDGLGALEDEEVGDADIVVVADTVLLTLAD